MPIDPAITAMMLNPPGIDSVAAEGKGVTLADMLVKNQLGQLGLQSAKQQVAAWADPEFLAQVSAMIQGNAPDLSVLSRYREAAPSLFTGMQSLAEKQADFESK